MLVWTALVASKIRYLRLMMEGISEIWAAVR